MNSRMPWRWALAATRPMHVGRGRIQERHRGEIDHEGLALVGDAVEHAADRRRRAEEERAGDAIDQHVADRSRARDRRARVRRCRRRHWSAATSGERSSMPVISAMRWMNSTAPSAKPTRMPSVRSRKIVSRKVASSTTASPREARSSVANSCFSAMFQATDDQHGGERGQRDVARERRRDQHEQQQEDRMQHARDRPARAGADVGRGARDRAGDADAAEQRRADVGDALRHQLAIGAVAAPGHAVGDHRRQQRFDGAEQREGDRVGQHGLSPSRARTPATPARAIRAGCRRSAMPMVSTGSDSTAHATTPRARPRSGCPASTAASAACRR